MMRCPFQPCTAGVSGMPGMSQVAKALSGQTALRLRKTEGSAHLQSLEAAALPEVRLPQSFQVPDLHGIAPVSLS